MRIKRAMGMQLAFLLVLALCTVTASAEPSQGEQKVVKVAYPIQPGLTEVDEQGNYSGYLYEYLEEVSQYTGWEYKFVQVPGQSSTHPTTLMDMLERGEVDLMGALLYSEALVDIFDFVGYSVGTVNTTLETFRNDTSTWLQGADIRQRIKVATMEATGARVEEMLAYCRMNRITPEIVVCDSQEGQLQAMREGRADALLNVSISPLEETKIVAKFAPRPFYCAVTKGRTDLVNELNAAIYSMEQADPYFTAQLYEKYFSKKDTTLVLSDQEQAYVRQAGTHRVGALMGVPPFQDEDQDGNPRGISFDLLDYISEQSGLSFQVVPVNTQAELDELVAQKAVDMVVGMTYDYDGASAKKITMSRPYTSMQYMLMMNPRISEKELAGKRLALPRDIPYNGTFLGNVVHYDTLKECIQAVNSGAADYTYADAYSAQFYVNQPEYADLHLVPQSYEAHRTCLGIVKPISAELLGIINKTILATSVENMQRIIYQNTTIQSALTIQNWMKIYPGESLLLVSGVLLCIIGVLTWGLTVRGRLNRKISLNMKKYTQIYELSSERFFEYDYKTNTLMVAVRDGKASQSPDALVHIGFDGPEAIADQDALSLFLELLRVKPEGIEEGKFLCPDGEEHWLRFTIKTIYDGAAPAYVIGKIANIDGEREEREELIYRAQHDSLTRLLNTAVFRQQVTEHLEAPWAQGALLLMDVDYFKVVNDTYGHLEGDRVLVQVADLLRELFNEDEVLGRMGGDEFAVFLRQVKDLDEVNRRCSTLCSRMRAIDFSDGNHITCSIGAALSREGQSYDALYEHADHLLYQAKDNGRGHCEAET